MKKITIDMINKISLSFVRAFNREPWNDSWTFEQAKERLTDIYNTPKFDGMVKIIDGEIAAVIMGNGQSNFDGTNFQILEFWVDTNCQGQGIGGKLLNEFIENLKNQNITKYFLITIHGKKTEDFYIKHGFLTSNDLCIMNY